MSASERFRDQRDRFQRFRHCPRAFRCRGHHVLGLARSDAAVASLTAAGVEAHRSALEDPDSLRSGAAASDGVMHAASVNDVADLAGFCMKTWQSL